MPRKKSPWSLAREAAHPSSAATNPDLAATDSAALRLAATEWVSDLVPWDLFATLTYDPARTGYVVDQGSDLRIPPSSWAAGRHFARWADNLALQARREVFAIGALESTRAGWPHFHAVLAMGGCDAGLFSSVSAEWFEHHGYCRLDRVDGPGVPTVAAYLAKYFTKDSVELHIRGELPGKIRPGQRWLTGLRVERST